VSSRTIIVSRFGISYRTSRDAGMGRRLRDGTILRRPCLADAFDLAKAHHGIEPTQQGAAGGFLAESLQQSVNANAVGGIGDGTIQFLVHDWRDIGAILA
jgi:hypothetical protein